VRIHEPPAPVASGAALAPPPQPTTKTLAFLLDAHTLRVVDLAPTVGGGGGPVTLATCTLSDSRITWLELSARGGLVLFRDKRRRLHLLWHPLRHQLEAPRRSEHARVPDPVMPRHRGHRRAGAVVRGLGAAGA
jgi:hypothetical protein